MSGPILELVSLTWGRIDYSLDGDTTLYIRAAGRAPGVQIVGSLIPRRKHYRLDASLPADRPFRLPLSPVIAPERIPPQALGVYGVRIDNTGTRTFVPLQVGAAPTAIEPANTIKVVLRPTDVISDLGWRMIVDRRAATPQFVPLGERAFAPGTPILFDATPPVDTEAAELELKYTASDKVERVLAFRIARR